MRILFCSAEVSPWAKVGGLADVAGSLPKALAQLGHEVVVAMPGYGMARQKSEGSVLESRSDVEVQMRPGRTIHTRLDRVEAEGFELWLIDGEEKFSRVQSSETVYTPLRDDYLFFSQAVFRCCEAMGWMPDVVHAHDWHMGFVPVLLREARTPEWAEVGSVFTIHNIAYQGEFGLDTLDEVGLPHSLFTWDKLETYGGVNFLKSGCAYADQVNTVSPTYANEITTPEYGWQLQGLMTYLRAQKRLRGILNGIDVAAHDPAIDPELPSPFSSQDLTGKGKCRTALHKELGLQLKEDQPLAAMICRLTEQKGFDLLVAAADKIVQSGIGIVVLATGDADKAAVLRQVEKRHPKSMKFVEAFDAPLAQRIYAGADIFMMPSAFEPCGLGQMFAMRYGTVPVARYTGGLADTVFEGINGFVFGERSPDALAHAMQRAGRAFRDPSVWRLLVTAGMRQDFGWQRSAREYETMYAEAAARRQRRKAAC